jgi:hypothetical protein
MRYTLLYILLSAMSLLRKSWVVPPTLGPPIHLCVMTQVQVPCLNLEVSSSFLPSRHDALRRGTYLREGLTCTVCMFSQVELYRHTMEPRPSGASSSNPWGMHQELPDDMGVNKGKRSDWCGRTGQNQLRRGQGPFVYIVRANETISDQ